MNAGSLCHKLLTRKFILMKLLKIIMISLTALIISAANFSCSKETPKVASTENDFANASLVQIFDATVKSTRNYVYVDNVPISGAAVAFGGVFPGTAFAFKVTPGNRNFVIKDTLASTTQIPFTFSEDFSAGRSYTIFTYDTITSVKHLTVTNNIVIPTDTTARLRFADFIYNSSSVPNVDVYSFRKGTTSPLFSNVQTNQVTDFIIYASGLTDTLYVYSTGTTSPLLAKSLLPSLAPQRSYTSVYIGSFKGAKSIATFANY